MFILLFLTLDLMFLMCSMTLGSISPSKVEIASKLWSRNFLQVTISTTVIVPMYSCNLLSLSVILTYQSFLDKEMSYCLKVDDKLNQKVDTFPRRSVFCCCRFSVSFIIEIFGSYMRSFYFLYFKKFNSF